MSKKNPISYGDITKMDECQWRTVVFMKFEVLEKSSQKLDRRVSKLDKRLWHFLIAIIVAIIGTLSTVLLSAIF